MSHRPVLLASDIHLGAIPAEGERAFVAWLESAGEVASEVVLNGDLFDFWFEYRHVVPRGHTRVLGALARLVDAGVPVTLMGGNHDWWGGSFLEDEVGLTFLRDPVVRELAGLRTFLAHGDGLGRGDLGYRALRLLLRSRITRWGFRWLHPDLGARVAGHVSETDARYGAPTEDDKERAQALEEWAVEKLVAEPDLDLVVLGHTHVPVLREVADGRWYVNAGDWVHHRTWLVLERDRAPRLEHWKG